MDECRRGDDGACSSVPTENRIYCWRRDGVPSELIARVFNYYVRNFSKPRWRTWRILLKSITLDDFLGGNKTHQISAALANPWIVLYVRISTLFWENEYIVKNIHFLIGRYFCAKHHLAGYFYYNKKASSENDYFCTKYSFLKRFWKALLLFHWLYCQLFQFYTWLPNI